LSSLLIPVADTFESFEIIISPELQYIAFDVFPRPDTLVAVAQITPPEILISFLAHKPVILAFVLTVASVIFKVPDSAIIPSDHL